MIAVLAPLLADTTATVDPAATFIRLLTVFLLAMWVGFEVITKVPQRLHTPLTSGSNAISGITAVGAIVVAGAMATRFGSCLGFVAVILAMINVVGGFVVTHRMLEMFQPKKK
jgi:NAD(P) transhydrogenase subunit alpha